MNQAFVFGGSRRNPLREKIGVYLCPYRFLESGQFLQGWLACRVPHIRQIAQINNGLIENPVL
jgi:hypothetical protein